MADRILVMGKDPGRILGQVAVHLHHPRRPKDTAFQALVDRVYAAVTGRTGGEAEVLGTAPGTPGVTRRLPAAQVESLAGLVEKAAAAGGRGDLYLLAAEAGLAFGELLPIVEAAERLGLVRVEQGDLIVTAQGRTYADAGILARKELMAGRMLRVPTMRWIFETLQQDDDQRVDRQYFVEALQADLGDDAEQQLDIAVDWGRFAELFTYDSDSHELYLES
jgi:NitT/TauT family transport system ATP-binding protein